MKLQFGNSYSYTNKFNILIIYIVLYGPKCCLVFCRYDLHCDKMGINSATSVKSAEIILKSESNMAHYAHALESTCMTQSSFLILK